MGRRKIPFHQSPSQRYAAEVAERQRLTAIRERHQERRAERRARIRAERAEGADAPAVRTIRAILDNPSPAGLKRLARYCEANPSAGPVFSDEVRTRAARAILVLAHGAVPVRGWDDGDGDEG